MKKFILGLAFLSIATVSFNASAQNCNNNKNCGNNCVVEKCDNKCDNKKDCSTFNCGFSNLNLTDQQKGKIEALQKALNSSRDELKAKAKKARENKDTTFNGRKAMLEMRTKYINDLSEILTPAQYVEYLKNYYVKNPGTKGQIGKDGRPAGKDFKGKGNKNKPAPGNFDRKREGKRGNR